MKGAAGSTAWPHLLATRLLPFAAVLLAFTSPASAAELTFLQALDHVQRANETVLAARAEVGQKREEELASRGLSLPVFELEARAVRIDAPIVIDLDPIRQIILQLHPNVLSAAVPPFRVNVVDQVTMRGTVRGTWPIFTGGKISAARRAAAAEVRSAEAQAREVDDRTTTELVHRYFGLVLAERAVAVRRDIVAGLAAHLHHATRLEEEGMIARAERLHAEVAHAEAERELRSAERAAELARIALANTMASDDTGIVAASPLFLIRTLPPVEELRAHALQLSPQLARVAAQRDLATQGTRVAEAQRWPDIGLFGYRELYKPDLTILDPTWAVGVGMHVTLFDGNAREHRIRASRERETRVRLIDDKARRDLATLVEKRYQEAIAAREQWQTLDTTRALAEENLRVRERAFQEGFATSLEVVDARLTLEKVALTRLVAAHDFVVALADLLEASGDSARFPEYMSFADVEVEE